LKKLKVERRPLVKKKLEGRKQNDRSESAKNEVLKKVLCCLLFGAMAFVGVIIYLFLNLISSENRNIAVLYSRKLTVFTFL
jgi:hypothetical protein